MMKIDMLSMAANFTNSQDIKTEQGGKEFFKVLTQKIGNSHLEEGSNLETQGDDEMEDDLAALIAALINNFSINDNKLDNGFNLKELNELVGNIQGTDLFSLEKLNELLSENQGNELQELFNNFNLELEKLEHLSKDDKNNLFLKLLNKLEVGKTSKESILVNHDLEVELEALNKGEADGSDTFIDYRKIINNMGMEGEDKLFEAGSFKHRNILVEEKPTNVQGELSLLNRIAFSSETITEGAKEVAPVIVRNEFLGPDVLKVVKYLSNNQIQELNVKITPKELGEVNIKLLKTEDNTELIITLTNKKAFEVIKANVNEIEKHLVNLDVKIKDVVVQVKSEVNSDFSGSFNEQFNKNNSREERQNNFSRNNSSFEEEEKPNSKDDSNINLLI